MPYTNLCKFVTNFHNPSLWFPLSLLHFISLSLCAFMCLCITEAQKRLWVELTSGAESGWDFSSRWYIDITGRNNGTLSDTQTSSILPADLNAIMCRNERLLASFHRILGKRVKTHLFVFTCTVILILINIHIHKYSLVNCNGPAEPVA